MTIDFRIEVRGVVPVIVDSIGCRPATRAEVAMWEEIERLRAQVDARQAKVDALMLEFCPDEMTDDQLDHWARHQQPARRDGR